MSYEQVTVADGKYTVQIGVGLHAGQLNALRYGEPWQDLTGNNLVYWLAVELREARVEVERLKAVVSNPQPKGTPEPVAWIRWEWNRTGGKSLEFFKPDELSLSDEARGVVYDPLYAAPSVSPAPAPEHVPVSPEHEAAIDAAVGLVLLPPIRVTTEVYTELKAASEASGLIVQAVVRERISAPSPAVGAGDERQDVGGHIRAAANARVAQQADDDTRRLDYLQKKQATISLVPDGRDEKGTRHAFMVGGWHCSVNRDVRASIDAAMGESQPPVQDAQP
jgi:hypothetical protein